MVAQILVAVARLGRAIEGQGVMLEKGELTGVLIPARRREGYARHDVVVAAEADHVRPPVSRPFGKLRRKDGVAHDRRAVRVESLQTELRAGVHLVEDARRRQGRDGPAEAVPGDPDTDLVVVVRQLAQLGREKIHLRLRQVIHALQRAHPAAVGAAPAPAEAHAREVLLPGEHVGHEVDHFPGVEAGVLAGCFGAGRIRRFRKRFYYLNIS